MFLTIFITFVITQRLIELMIAKRNEKYILQQGGFEVGANHYPFMVAMHSLFFIILLGEILLLNRDLSFLWLFFLAVFLLMQIGRFWCLYSLGPFWNTKIIILPKAKVVKKGPYRYVKHPNYLIVTIELLVIPLLFNAFFTAILFTLFNIFILSIRIPLEEKALKKATNYQEVFKS